MGGYALWISIARVVIPIEGIIGMSLNALLIVNLAQTRMEKTAKVYHNSCLIAAVSSFYFALLVTITIDVGELVDGTLIGVLYGPLLTHLSPQAAEGISVAFMAQIHTMWQIVPAPSILQWLSLSRRHMSNTARMILAYSVPIAFQIIGWITMVKAIPPPELRDQMISIASRLHGTNQSEFHVFGGRIFDETRISVADIAVFDFLPSFTASYALFAWTAFKVRAELRWVGSKLSTRTELMQRRFFRMQLAQVTLPLVLPTIPMGILIVAVILGRELAGISFLFSFTMWPIPAFTAMLLLGFVQKTSIKTSMKPKISVNAVSMTSMNNL